MKRMKTKIAALASTGAIAALIGGMLFLAQPSPARADGFAITLGSVHIGYWSHGHRYYHGGYREWCERPEYYYHPGYYHRAYYHPEYYRVVYRERYWHPMWHRDWHQEWRERHWHHDWR